MSLGGREKPDPSYNTPKSKKIRVGDKFYISPDVKLEGQVGLRVGHTNGTTLRVRAIISPKQATVDVIFAGNEGAVSDTVVVPSDKLKTFPRERRASDTIVICDLNDKRVDELTDSDSQSTSLRKSDKPDVVRALMLQAFHKKLARAGLKFVD